MFISCPNCSTRYNVTPAQLGAEGKSVKCSNCGNTWHQRPVADPPPPMRPRGQTAQPQYPQYPQQPPQQSAYPYPPHQGYPGYPPPPPQGYPGYPPYPPPPPGYPAPDAAQPAPPPPAPAAPPPPPEPEPEEEEEAVLPEMEDSLDDDPMAAFATDDDEDDDDDALSSEDIEAMFGDDDEDATPLGSMVEDAPDDDDDDDVDLDDLDDLEEPEPIPQVFTAEETGDDEYEDDDEFEDEKEKPAGKGTVMKIIIAAVLVILLGIIGAAVFLKETVIEMFPAAEGVYSMIGLSDDSLGAGLSINDVKSTRESISGKDVLVVRGVIANISDRERPVPMLELRLSDLDGKLVQSAKTAPLKTQLTGGDQIGFKIQVEDPSPLARRLEVTFIERPGEEKPAQ
ncbi:MAG: DUF3426 domain-containing protein [Rhodospirillales bacterium]